MRVLFIGGTKRGHLTLKALIDRAYHIVGIISLQQDAHEIERYERVIKSIAEESEIPLYETKWMKDRDYAALISDEIRPDIALVVGCRILIPPAVYQVPPLGTLAVHDSLLPAYRGFAPLNWSILNGENHTGVTLFYLNELMDGGDIVAQQRVSIAPDDTAPLVYEKVCHATVDLILGALPRLERGEASRTLQDYARGSLTCSRIPADGMIDWRASTQAIHDQVRGLTYPYPGAFTFYEGKKLIIWTAQSLDNAPLYTGRIPGRVVGRLREQGSVDVLTGDGILRVSEVQLQDAMRTAATEVIRSVRATLGLRETDLLDRIQGLEQQVRALTTMLHGDESLRSARTNSQMS